MTSDATELAKRLRSRADTIDRLAAEAAWAERDGLLDALEDMVICAESMDWNNAEIHNAIAALAACKAKGER